LQNTKILFEIDSFFASVQSAIDFLACVLSRYIKGKNTDEFDKLHKFLENSDHPISVIIHKAWVNWVKESAYYRDYLIHKGVLRTAMATTVKTSSKMSDPALNEYVKMIQKEQNPIVFPLPKKPDTSIRFLGKTYWA
jgi:hypothetical protein